MSSGTLTVILTLHFCILMPYEDIQWRPFFAAMFCVTTVMVCKLSLLHCTGSHQETAFSCTALTPCIRKLVNCQQFSRAAYRDDFGALFVQSSPRINNLINTTCRKQQRVTESSLWPSIQLPFIVIGCRKSPLSLPFKGWTLHPLHLPRLV